MKNRESVNDYFAQTLTITNKMRMYDYVVCSIEKSHDLNFMIVDELQSNPLVHKQRMNDHNSHEEQALKMRQALVVVGEEMFLEVELHKEEVEAEEADNL
ncbi:hypothetical protein CR513_04468, partial [Mucuna pruriens]